MTKAVVLDKRKKEKQYFHKEGSVNEGQKTFRKVENGLRYPTSSLLFNNSDKTKNEHPTQKPLDLMEYLVKTYTNENDMILDNTMGSGTTNLACIKLNRKSIGIEKEKQYYDVAVRRASKYCH
jgi:site-specific DNA-methyltransferase (adenine-specific)